MTFILPDSLFWPGVQTHGAVLTFTPSSPLEPGTYDIAVAVLRIWRATFVTPFYSSFEVASLAAEFHASFRDFCFTG